jgi:hypothetical protein
MAWQVLLEFLVDIGMVREKRKSSVTRYSKPEMLGLR